MQITLGRDERPILLTALGLPAKATNEQITAAVAHRLTAGAPPPPPAAPQPAVASRAADGHDLIAAAVADGRIPASRAEHYAQRYAQDPAGTAATIAKLTAVPKHLLDAAASAQADSSYPKEWLPDVHRTRGRVTHGGD
jgi:hypothetical protein